MPETPDKSRPHPWQRTKGLASSRRGAWRRSGYAELTARSNFSFLTGASHADELVKQAADLDHCAIAITDVNSLAGIVRAHVAAKAAGLPLVVGSRLRLDEPAGLSLLLYATDRDSYGRLCRLLTTGKRRAAKGECRLDLHDVIEHHEGLLAAVEPPEAIDEPFVEVLRGLRGAFDDDRLSLAASCLYAGDDARRLRRLADLADHVAVPLVATNDAHYHHPDRRMLQDVLACVHHGCTIDELGLRRLPNAERHLKSPDEMARLFADYPEALARTTQIAERAAGFSLDEIRYEYPDETTPRGVTPMRHLAALTWAGAYDRYPDGLPDKVRRQIEHEFTLIEELNYAPYFLTVHDLGVFARSRGILCQGRGAAANSAVCYCLGVTAVDPDRIDVLFERFVSRERNEPPDIDIDFEHERREEVIQYLYGRYGRDRASLTAEVITYRHRSAIREVGKALGLSLDCVDRLAKQMDWWDKAAMSPDALRETGLKADDPTVRHMIRLVHELLGFPRHLSQHVGGFVITRTPLCEMVPIENAAMPDRTVIEWDKDDIEAMGMLKVDCLGLGMLTCLSKGFGLLRAYVEGKIEARRHEGTEARRGEKATGTRGSLERTGYDSDSHFPRLDRLAEEHGTGSSHLSTHSANAWRGTIRPDQSDASGRGIGSFQYRRGLCASEQDRLSPLSSRGPGIIGRIGHSVRTGDQHGSHDPGGSYNPVAHPGSGSSTSRPDPQSRVTPPAPPHPSASATSSLRLFVSPSLCLAHLPPEDPAVYDMICEADTVGVFQIESRAQMSMLPRLRPRCYYDLVIEIAIVRPGPIVGHMVHPYLRRRGGEEPADYPDDTVRRVLGKTLGIPLFQEQAMQLAIECAGFTPGEADDLRRAIAAWKSKQKVIFEFGRKIVDGMIARGYCRAFAEQCFEQIKGFSEYGFPESHAASFALIVYASAWMKRYHPAAFAAALINSQPMGFYAPAQLVRDAKEHGVTVRPVDVNHSTWDCTLEPPPPDNAHHDAGPALRLGMRLIQGMRRAEADALAAAVAAHGPFRDLERLWRISGVRAAAMKALARADAFNSMDLDRRQALWQVRRLKDIGAPLFEPAERDAPAKPPEEPAVHLPPVPVSRQVVHDYQTLGMSLKAHPISFLRRKLDAMGATPNHELGDETRWPHGSPIRVAGIALVRQRPGSAGGVVFMTIEDETGIANLIFRPKVFEQFRKAARHSTVLLAQGTVERRGRVVHVMVRRAVDLTGEAATLTARSRDFH